MRGKLVHEPVNCSLGLGFGDGLGLWLGSGHLRLSGDRLGFIVLGDGFRVRGRKVESRDCALASDLVKAQRLSYQKNARTRCCKTFE